MKYEYHTYVGRGQQVDGPGLDDWLNTVGAEGYSLTQLVMAPSPSGFTIVAVAERAAYHDDGKEEQV